MIKPGIKNGFAGSAIFLFVMITAIFFTLVFTVFARAQGVFVPNFWDPNERFVSAETAGPTGLKFLTTTDFPPFNFIDRKKRLSGFHIDLARAICEKLGIANRCQIQALPWEELKTALENGEGDAIIAGIEISAKSRSEYEFTRPYLHIPGRFIARRGDEISEPVYEALANKTVALVEGSSHQAFFTANFLQRKFQTFPTRQLALNALGQGQVDAVFTDALSASFWLASDDADDCCEFAGSGFLSVKFFGQGMAIAVARSNHKLEHVLNRALKAISEEGVFERLYLKYFPLGLF